MNEVGFSQVQGPQLPRTNASSTGAVAEQQGGNKLPTTDENSKTTAAVNEASQVPSDKSADVDNAVASVNDYVQSIERDLHFSVDEDLEQTVIKVVDTDSGDVIRQIPEAVFLELARNLKEDGELRLVNALG